MKSIEWGWVLKVGIVLTGFLCAALAVLAQIMAIWKILNF